jgi:filamentous hemagglutinin family protein
MNRVYRLIWSQIRSAWIPVAETARGRGKSGRARSIANPNVLAAAVSLALSPLAYAGPPVPPCVAPACGTSAVGATSHPLGGKVVSGTGTITQSGNTTDIRQSSADVSIDWQSFNIGSQATVDFLQPSASAVAVNRILGNNGSHILGHLDANGQVYLINPNGVIFGKGAEVNVGGLVASTLDVSDSGLSGSTRSFGGSGTGSIINQGTINATNGGYVALIGNRVSNQGVITARLGTVALGSGSAVTLDFSGNRLVHLQVDRSTLNDLAENKQLIQADGGLVIMTAGAQRALLASVVNNSGIIEARTVENHNGTIELLGGMTAGTVNVSGTLDASAPNGGNGGFIETNAAHVEVADGTQVTTAAARGLTGSWLVDPQDFTIAPSGGDITGATLSTELGTTSVTLLSSSGAKAGSGNINVDDTVTWSANTLTLTAANNINVNAVMTARNAASLALNPSTANGADAAVPGGTVVMGLNGSGFTGMVNFNSTGTLSVSGTPYTVINSLGATGSTTGTDLQGINGNLSGYYALGSNIDATATSSWNAGAGFTPIGISSINFTGTFNGLGHTIRNLTINLPSTNYVGLFGYTGVGSVIQNVGLSGGSVSGSGYVGGLVGFNNGGTVSNSYATGSVGGGSGFAPVGGLVGLNHYGTVSNSYATGSVTGTREVGGLVGFMDGPSTVSNSYATGSVSGTGDVGGLVGFVDANTISNSYATGSVSGSTNVGGLVGNNHGTPISNSYAMGSVHGSNYVGGLVGWNNGGTISNSYATGSVSGSSYVGGLVGLNHYGTGSNSYATGSVSGTSNVGGLVGYNYGGTVSNSFWDTQTSGQASSAGGTGLTTAQMQSASSFTGWSIATTGGSGDIWRIYQGHTFPLLISFLTPLTLTDAPDTMVTYNGGAQSGPTTSISGVLGVAATGTNAGFYNGYYSTQQGYDITGGNLTINQLASVAWVGGATGNWSTASNWAGGVIPDLSNVAAVTIPKGTTVTYDAGVPGTTFLTSLTDAGKLVMAAGDLSTTGNLSTAGYRQTGGFLNVGGALSINSTAGAVTLGNIDAGSLSITSTNGAITQLAGSALDVTGTSSLTADNGVAGARDVKYNITLSQAGDSFGGAVSANGLKISLLDTSASGLTLGNTTATGTLTATSRAGAITQANSTALSITGASSLTADNGVSGAGDVKYDITLANATNNFTGAVSSNGLNVTLEDKTKGIILGNTTATGTLSVTSLAGNITQAATTALNITGASTLTADNGLTGASEKRYAVTLAQAGDSFGGAVTAKGSAITLKDTTALTAILDSSRASTLTAAGNLTVSGTVGTKLKTTTTGTGHTTTFGNTTVGTSLAVTSTGAVTEAVGDELLVHGAGTDSTDPVNHHVTVNGVKGAVIE